MEARGPGPRRGAPTVATWSHVLGECNRALLGTSEKPKAHPTKHAHTLSEGIDSSPQEIHVPFSRGAKAGVHGGGLAAVLARGAPGMAPPAGAFVVFGLRQGRDDEDAPWAWRHSHFRNPGRGKCGVGNFNLISRF